MLTNNTYNTSSTWMHHLIMHRCTSKQHGNEMIFMNINKRIGKKCRYVCTNILHEPYQTVYVQLCPYLHLLHPVDEVLHIVHAGLLLTQVGIN